MLSKKHKKNIKKTKHHKKKRIYSKYKKIKGGTISNFIKKGSYGCAYRPPLQCELGCNEERCKTGISKYMNKNNSDNELIKFDILGLENIDPLGEYHIKKPHQCKPSDNLEFNMNNCNIDVKIPSLLIYEDGGKDLNAYLKTHHNPSDVLNNLEKILKFILIMIKNKIIHFDIKKDNIVTGKNENNFRLIDFGLSENYQNDFNFKKLFLSIYQPWMITVIFLINKNFEKIPDQLIYNHINKFLNYNNNKYIVYYFKKNGINKDNLFLILKSIQEKLIKEEKSYELILNKIDLYSFAMILYIFFYNTLIKLNLNYKSVIDNFIDKTQIFNPNPFLIKSADTFYLEYQVVKEKVMKILENKN
jgi:hypothetical protein